MYTDNYTLTVNIQSLTTQKYLENGLNYNFFFVKKSMFQFPLLDLCIYMTKHVVTLLEKSCLLLLNLKIFRFERHCIVLGRRNENITYTIIIMVYLFFYYHSQAYRKFSSIACMSMIRVLTIGHNNTIVNTVLCFLISCVQQGVNALYITDGICKTYNFECLGHYIVIYSFSSLDP